MANANPPSEESQLCHGEVREDVAKLGSGKAPDICNITAVLLIAGGEAMISGLHAVSTAVWQSGAIFPD